MAKESQSSKEVREYLELNRLWYTRNNVLKGWYSPKKGVKQYWIETGKKGIADYSTILPSGVTLYIEIKKPGGGSQLESQRDFEAICIKNNAPYIIARSAKDISDFLQTYFENTDYYKRFLYL